MSRTVSAGMLKAIDLIRTKHMSPWAAAKEVGIADSTIYRSSLYLDYLNETVGPAKAAQAMEMLKSSPAWGGNCPEVTPLTVARELEVPVQLVYNAEPFQARVLELLGSGVPISEIPQVLQIPVEAIKKLPRYLEQTSGERVTRALDILEASWASGRTTLPQDVAKEIKISVNAIYRSERFQKRVDALLREGASLRQISEQLGIGHRAVKTLPVYQPYARGTGRPTAHPKPEDVSLANNVSR